MINQVRNVINDDILWKSSPESNSRIQIGFGNLNNFLSIYAFVISKEVMFLIKYVCLHVCMYVNLGCELFHKKCSILKIELYKPETDK